jgi:predicted CoA-binding protein
MSEPGAGRHDSYLDDNIRGILKSVRTIAIVGATNNPARPSYIVTKYLKERGYDVVPVNPRLAGHDVLGLPAYGSLAEVPRPIDMVEIFRNSASAGPVTDEALALDPLPKVIWMQLSVRDDEAAARAEAKGITVIMNRPALGRDRLAGNQLAHPLVQAARLGRARLPEPDDRSQKIGRSRAAPYSRAGTGSRYLLNSLSVAVISPIDGFFPLAARQLV